MRGKALELRCQRLGVHRRWLCAQGLADITGFRAQVEKGAFPYACRI